MTINFLHPAFLLLLLALPLWWLYPRRIEERVHGVLRTLLIATLVVALARPVGLAEDGAAFQVLVLDRSASLGARQRELSDGVARRWAAQIEDKKRAAVVILGGTGNTALPAAAFTGIASIVQLPGPGSSLSSALAAAARQIPDGSTGSVTLVSDGLSTDRRWGPAVQRLTSRGIAVNTARLERDERDVYPTGLSTDDAPRAGQTTHVKVQVAGQGRNVRVRLFDASGRQLASSQPLEVAGTTTVALELEPRAAGFITIRAETSADGDSVGTNNVLSSTLAVQPATRMLYLGERMQHGAARLQELLGAGFEVEDGSERDLSALEDLAPHDLVMVDDRRAARMPEPFQQRLAHAVRERGLGLIFAGGKAAFGAGGYQQTTLERTLPVELKQTTEKREPSTALALIIDTSGSMSGMRMDLAKQVARLAVRRLGAHDRVGIVEFYGNKHWALPLQSAANKAAIDRAIGRMQAQGGTVLYPGLEEAFYGLKNLNTRYKHILVVTDAGVENADYEALLRRMARENINVSTVLVGSQPHNQRLIDLAAWGHGRFYSASDRYSLPEVVLKQPAATRLPAYQSGAFKVVARGAEGWWGAIERDTLPALSGYVETGARTGAEVLVEIAQSAQPVLASWQYGLGRVTALMTEPVGPGTQGWRDWPQYGRLLARIAQRTADGSQAFSYVLTREDRTATLTARRYSSNDTLRPRAALLDAQDRPGSALEFRQDAPGYFTAQWSADPSQELRVGAGAVDLDGAPAPRSEMRLVSAAGAGIADERQVDPSHALDLESLAAATAGAVIDPARPRAADFARARRGSGSLELHSLWRYALLLALLLYIAELIYRRWPRT